MRFIEQIKRFEKEYNTTVLQNKHGLTWVCENQVRVMSSTALGVYKRYDVDMFDVLEQITITKGSGGNLKGALNYVRKLKEAVKDNVWV